MQAYDQGMEAVSHQMSDSDTLFARYRQFFADLSEETHEACSVFEDVESFERWLGTLDPQTRTCVTSDYRMGWSASIEEDRAELARILAEERAL